MRRDLLHRLAKLEDRFRAKTEMPLMIITHRTLSSERHANLAPGERIVLDWLRNDNQWVEAIERITSDPHDTGRDCPRNSVNEDLIREYHLNCPAREKGHCRICEGVDLL